MLAECIYQWAMLLHATMPALLKLDGWAGTDRALLVGKMQLQEPKQNVRHARHGACPSKPPYHMPICMPLPNTSPKPTRHAQHPSINTCLAYPCFPPLSSFPTLALISPSHSSPTLNSSPIAPPASAIHRVFDPEFCFHYVLLVPSLLLDTCTTAAQVRSVAQTGNRRPGISFHSLSKSTHVWRKIIMSCPIPSAASPCASCPLAVFSSVPGLVWSARRTNEKNRSTPIAIPRCTVNAIPD